MYVIFIPAINSEKLKILYTNSRPSSKTSVILHTQKHTMCIYIYINVYIHIFFLHVFISEVERRSVVILFVLN